MRYVLKKLKHTFYTDDCLFGAVELTKNAGSEEYGYSDYDIRFDARLQFSLPAGELGRNVTLFLVLILVHLDTLILEEKIS